MTGDMRALNPHHALSNRHPRHRPRHFIPPTPAPTAPLNPPPPSQSFSLSSSLPLRPPFILHLPPGLLSNISLLPFHVLLRRAPRILLPRPQTRQHHLLDPWLHAPLVKPRVQAILNQLCDFRHVLQARAGAEKGAHGQVEPIVGEKGEGECGWGGGGWE